MWGGAKTTVSGCQQQEIAVGACVLCPPTPLHTHSGLQNRKMRGGAAVRHRSQFSIVVDPTTVLYRGMRSYALRRPVCVGWMWASVTFFGSSQVKSSSGATRPRGDHPDPNLLLPSSLRGLCVCCRGILNEFCAHLSLASYTA